jgi:hypothetical protein
VTSDSAAACMLALFTYLTLGLLFSAYASRRGQEPLVVLGGVVAWPLLLPAVTQGERKQGGPLAARIEHVFVALTAVLEELDADGWGAELALLKSALCRTDRRLDMVDRLLVDVGDSAALTPLKEARAQAEADLEAVLAEVVALRVQVGLHTLAGDADAVRRQLSTLVARARALEEIHGLAHPARG